jgi:hypothetical protein
MSGLNLQEFLKGTVGVKRTTIEWAAAEASIWLS